MPGESRFRHLMDTAPVMIWCSGPHGDSTYFNKVWLDFTGRTMQQELGDGWTVGIHPEDYDRRQTLYAEHFARREEFRVEYRLRRKDGEWRWVLGTGVPRYDAAGDFEGFIGSCIDITEMKAAAERRQYDLEEKAALLQELHHRVKNNAQVFASLLTSRRTGPRTPRSSPRSVPRLRVPPRWRLRSSKSTMPELRPSSMWATSRTGSAAPGWPATASGSPSR